LKRKKKEKFEPGEIVQNHFGEYGVFWGDKIITGGTFWVKAEPIIVNRLVYDKNAKIKHKFTTETKRALR